MINQDYIFISASPYSMVDKDTGEHIKGTTVFLLPLTGQQNEKVNGARPMKFNQPYPSFEHTYSKLQYLKKYNFVFEPAATSTGVKLQLNGLAQ